MGIFDWFKSALKPAPKTVPKQAKRIGSTGGGTALKSGSTPGGKTSDKPAKFELPKPTGGPASGGGGGGGYGYGGGGYGGGGGPTKSADKAQVAALNKLLNSGHGKARDQRLANIEKIYKQGDQTLLDNYNARVDALNQAAEDNELAEAASSWHNLSERARQAQATLIEAAAQGAGESDQNLVPLLAARNWLANQSEINRAFYDTDTANRTTLTDLTSDVKSSRFNLAQQRLSDEDQVWTTYANQIADVATQLANIYSNPYSDSYKKSGGKSALNKMVSAASNAWKNPGVDKSVAEWSGSEQRKQELLNNQILNSGWAGVEQKRPEGSTLRRW